MSQAGEAQNARVFNRDNWECAYCGLKCDHPQLWQHLVLDHIDPTKKRANDFSVADDANKVTACHTCNFYLKKAYPAKDLADAKRYVREKLRQGEDWYRRAKAGKIG